MLTEIVRGIVEPEPECQVVGEFPGTDLHANSLLTADADVLIVGSDEVREDDVAQIIKDCCRLRILGLSSDGSRALLHELRPQRIPLGELSPARLLSVVRGDPVTEPEVR
ncbi:MAG: hypothetical protein QOH66_1543 [Actinomycetota bacterium]|jgi:hypothetical protein|nr:hypothetical protein [Actinomycetota bacterium]